MRYDISHIARKEWLFCKVWLLTARNLKDGILDVLGPSVHRSIDPLFHGFSGQHHHSAEAPCMHRSQLCFEVLFRPKQGPTWPLKVHVAAGPGLKPDLQDRVTQAGCRIGKAQGVCICKDILLSRASTQLQVSCQKVILPVKPCEPRTSHIHDD